MRGLIVIAMVAIITVITMIGVSQSQPSSTPNIVTKTIHHDYDEHEELRNYIIAHPKYRLTNTITSCYGSGTGFGKASNGGECETTLVFESR